MARVSGGILKPAVKLPPSRKPTKKVKEPTPEVSDEEESFDEDFDEDEEFEDVESSDVEDEVPAKKQKTQPQNNDSGEEDSDEDVESAEDEDSEAESMEVDADPKSFVLAPESDEEHESDREVEIALKAGLVDSKTVKHPNVPSKYMVNKVDLIKKRLAEMKKQPWINTVDVLASPELVFEKDANDDFEREAMFHKQATDAVEKAVAKLKELDVPVLRPDDYFAEMVKSDRHMQRIRKVLLDRQKEKERRETVRRIRNEKKFAVKVQKEVEQQKIAEKRKFTEAVKKHKKGMKGQLEMMLNNANRLEDFDDDTAAGKNAGAKKPKMSRVARNKKFGFGGRKAHNKRNDKASFEDVGHTGKRKFGGHQGRNNKFSKKKMGKKR